jgi:aryl-alcohol dehydrogenase-like predicted oxidoreductase
LKTLWKVVAKGMVEHIGVSVYSPQRAGEVVETEDVDIVQIPGNILDHRFERAGVFDRAKERDIEIYVRSIFLQGLLFMDPNTLSAHMEFARPVLERVRKLAREFDVTPQVLSLQYLKAAFPCAHVLVGVETPKQVRENVAAWNLEATIGLVDRVRETFQDVSEGVLDPRRWSM